MNKIRRSFCCCLSRKRKTMQSSGGEWSACPPCQIGTPPVDCVITCHIWVSDWLTNGSSLKFRCFLTFNMPQSPNRAAARPTHHTRYSDHATGPQGVWKSSFNVKSAHWLHIETGCPWHLKCVWSEHRLTRNSFYFSLYLDIFSCKFKLAPIHQAVTVNCTVLWKCCL